MEVTLIHLYPDWMNLYGSYANLWVLRRCLCAMGHTVTVRPVSPTEGPEALAGADFVFLGAGTERAQRAAAGALQGLRGAILDAAQAGVGMLFAGSAMELLGRSVTARTGETFPGLGLADFTSRQLPRRIVGDVYGRSSLLSQPVVGFMNKCGLVEGVDTPLLTALDLGFGNQAEGGAEGFCRNGVLASQLTGPLLVKNPHLLELVAAGLCRRRGEPAPAQIPVDSWAIQGYETTREQLQLRAAGR